jgi:hypothetical protein
MDLIPSCDPSQDHFRPSTTGSFAASGDGGGLKMLCIIFTNATAAAWAANVPFVDFGTTFK